MANIAYDKSFIKSAENFAAQMVAKTKNIKASGEDTLEAFCGYEDPQDALDDIFDIYIDGKEGIKDEEWYVSDNIFLVFKYKLVKADEWWIVLGEM